MLRQRDQFVGWYPVFFVGVMRMGADRAIDVWKSFRDLEQRAKPSDPRRNGDDPSNARGSSPCDDVVEVIGEIGKIQMAVAVDEHRFPTVQVAVGSI
jgi:hypothetical protein